MEFVGWLDLVRLAHLFWIAHDGLLAHGLVDLPDCTIPRDAVAAVEAQDHVGTVRRVGALVDLRTGEHLDDGRVARLRIDEARELRDELGLQLIGLGAAFDDALALASL